MAEWIYGRRTVAEHLREAPGTCERLLVARESRIPPEVLEAAREAGLTPDPVARRELDEAAGGANHQGVCLRVGGWGYRDLEDLVARAREPGRLPLLVALDCVQDPRNLGAVLRVADGVGAAGVVIPQDRAAGLGAAAARTASGALATVPVARVVNLARALRELSEQGFWALGASGEAAGGLFEAEVPFPCVLVLGGEHQGLRRNVAAACHRLAALPMAGAVGSLNVAVAAGVFSYELLRRWRCRRP